MVSRPAAPGLENALFTDTLLPIALIPALFSGVLPHIFRHIKKFYKNLLEFIRP